MYCEDFASSTSLVIFTRSFSSFMMNSCPVACISGRGCSKGG